MSIESVSILRYSGISSFDINQNNKNLVDKEYTDKSYYPFKSPEILTAPVNGQFVVSPSVLKSSWVIKNFGHNGGDLVFDGLNNAESEVFTFEVMVIRGNGDDGTINLPETITWLGNSAPDISAVNYIYFLVFRAIYVNNNWIIVGNSQGSVSIA